MTLSTRFIIALALLLLGFGLLIAWVGNELTQRQSLLLTQQLSQGLAHHIVDHWPELNPAKSPATANAQPQPTARDNAEARAALMKMLMFVNPAIQVYLVDADGTVNAYIGEPGMVRTPRVELQPIRAFLAGDSLPILGTDPMGSGEHRVFSVAAFPPTPAEPQPGYLYIVLDGAVRRDAALAFDQERALQQATIVAALGLLLTFVLGYVAFRRIARPLRELALRMRGYRSRAAVFGRTADAAVADRDEVHALDEAFDAMTARIEEQSRRERQQADEHHEVIEAVAHDIRTPLTALHGHLEALARDDAIQSDTRKRLIDTALAQSDKVRRLSQQLFELARLQEQDLVLQKERFRIDELVTDTVQKFELVRTPSPVALDTTPPGRIEVDGDLQLIERAITNLIDNSIRHAGGAAPARIELRRRGNRAELVVQDVGPGLPAEVARRLEHQEPLRGLPRRDGSMGGLGLAIAQRVAQLHGGALTPLPSPEGGTRLCLSLPLVLQDNS